MTELYIYSLLDGFPDHPRATEVAAGEGPEAVGGPRIRDYFYTSVCVACLCFYMPTGVLAVRYARKARSSLRQGNEEEAERFSQHALLLILTTVLTLPILLITAILT
uniref:Uncharacterized protein LOC111101303 n=1 Tax=Crassostrea virginica TaxID=6565 RepID=A0A8B8ADB3_CRAVI|nr:uncharacterized protein LOC111101303 [Crassostrea virginica]